MTKKNDMMTNTMIEEATLQAQTMMLSADCLSDGEFDARNVASSIHNLVHQSEELGMEGVELRSALLREKLVGVETPNDDFIFFGGYAIAIPTLFMEEGEKKAFAEKMATADFEASQSGREVSETEVQETLMRFAALDDFVLGTYTDKLSELSDITGFGGPFTIMADGSVMSLHYINDDDEYEYEDDEDFSDDECEEI